MASVVAVFLITGFLASSAQPYTQIQYIGFPVMTGYDSAIAPNGLLFFNDIKPQPEIGKYAGVDDVEQDIQSRLGVLKTAIDTAASSPEVDQSATTLKLFLAPEFTWRPQQGAYNISSPEFLSIGDRLCALVANDTFADW